MKKTAMVFLAVFSILVAQNAGHLAPVYAQEVDRKLYLPPEEQLFYGEKIPPLLADRGQAAAQYVLVVDRNPFVQAAFLYWWMPGGELEFIGASPVSTGKPGRYDHFTTPLGVFEHSPANPDFRALGTRNENGIRGYGRQGLRVFDLGWQTAERGWGKGGPGTMRLQMHATDPDLLEDRVGTVQSEGCIRIPESLNRFLDHYGILDAGYEAEMAQSKTFWVLPKNREATPWSGRFVIVVDSERAERPAWSIFAGPPPS